MIKIELLINNIAFLGISEEIWWALLRVIIIILFVLLFVPPIIWWERRLLGFMQDRVGPNRVGPLGLLQPIADGLKLFMKEEVIPYKVDRLIYVIAPWIALFPAFVIAATVPWGPNPNLTPVADVDIGVLWILAISSLGVYGVTLGGWASNNKYSLLGGLRSTAQLVSYELAMGVALYSVLLPTGSLRLTEVVKTQHGPLAGVVDWAHNWFILSPWGLIAGAIFFICMIAETNRAPFDLPEAESELIAGFHTEYSSMKFAVFFMGEYAMMAAFSGIFSVLFLGGWSPFINFEYLAGVAQQNNIVWLSSTCAFLGGGLMAPIWFIGKIVFFLTVYIWIRATLPRLRYDQLMNVGWKYLLPIAALNFVTVAIWMLFGLISYVVSIAILVLLYLYVVVAFLKPKASQDKRMVELLDIPANTAKIIEVRKL